MSAFTDRLDRSLSARGRVRPERLPPPERPRDFPPRTPQQRRHERWSRVMFGDRRYSRSLRGLAPEYNLEEWEGDENEGAPWPCEPDPVVGPGIMLSGVSVTQVRPDDSVTRVAARLARTCAIMDASGFTTTIGSSFMSAFKIHVCGPNGTVEDFACDAVEPFMPEDAGKRAELVRQFGDRELALANLAQHSERHGGRFALVSTSGRVIASAQDGVIRGAAA